MTQFDTLWEHFLSGSLSREEAIELQQLLANADRQVPEAILHLLRDRQGKGLEGATAPMEKEQQLLMNILRAGKVHQRRVVRRMVGWGSAAAAVMGIIVIGAVFFSTPHPVVKAPAPVTDEIAHDIAPGHSGAILTLSNGQQVVLDSAGNGVVASQTGTQVLLKDGQLIYNATGSFQVAYNTVTTARGRTFRVVLPDSSVVWLNAGSSLRYPTAFTGRERNVEMTGEGYFEIARRADQPFIVRINATTNVEVLGTHFNINSYTDETSVNTTLLQGAVRINCGGQSMSIIPGDQARVKGDGSMRRIKLEDTDHVIAWIKGVFDFKHADIREVMRQLSRWYDVEVVYAGRINPREFEGKIGRDLQLSQVLKGMQNMGVHFKLEEGRRLVVLP